MNERTKVGLEILGASLVLGLLGNALLRETPWGINIFLWIGALVATMIFITMTRRRELLKRENWLVFGGLIFFSACFAWRDATWLYFFDVLILLSLLSISVLPMMNISTRAASLTSYFGSALVAGMNACFAPLALVFGDISWNKLPRGNWTKNLLPILRGLLIAIPILLVFGALFVAADAVYKGMVEKAFDFGWEFDFGQIVLVSFLTWICAGYLRSVLIGNLFSAQNLSTVFYPQPKAQNLSVVQNQTTENSENNEPPMPTQTRIHETDERDTPKNAENAEKWLPQFSLLGTIETAIILGSIDVLFLSFVLVQLRYFFGGMNLVQSTTDLKLAEYARSGFGELVVVSILVLPILLAVHWLLRKDILMNVRLYRVLAGVQIVLLFVIMFSAVQRMLLYTGNLGYGWTEARFYPLAFMVWLAIVLLCFMLTVLRGEMKYFASGSLIAACLLVAGLHIFNPSDFIVRQNISLMQQGRSFDSYHLTELSDDAVPAIIETFPLIPENQRCSVANNLIERGQIGNYQYTKRNFENWRTWNYSRSQAQRIVGEKTKFLQTVCPPMPTVTTTPSDSTTDAGSGTPTPRETPIQTRQMRPEQLKPTNFIR